jgi:phage-related protein
VTQSDFREATESKKMPKAVADAVAGMLLAFVEVSATPEQVFRALMTNEVERWWTIPGVYHLKDWKADLRAQGRWSISQLIAAVGLEQVGLPHVRPVQTPLWEIRLSGQSGIARALYVTARGKRVVILRAFVKRTQKTPNSEIKLALERAKLLKS